MQRIYRLAIAFHVAVLSLVFPVTRIFDASLPHHVDYSYWLYNCTAIDRGLRDSWQMWVYNPYVAAGYPEGAIAGHLAHHGGRGWELATHLLAPYSFAVAFKAFPFLCMLAGPLLMGVTAALLAFSAVETAIVGTLAIVDWWGSNLAEIAVDNGTVCFQLAVAGSLVVVAFFSRFSAARRWTEALALLASSIFFFWIHPLLLIIAGIPALGLYAVCLRALSPRDHLTLIVIAALTALAALPWLAPPLTISFQDLDAHAYPFGQSYGVFGLLRTALGISGPLFILYLGAFGVRRWYRDGRRELAIGWIAALTGFLLLGYFGSIPPLLENLQPGRFKTVLFVFAIVPSAHGLSDGIAWLRDRRIAAPLRVALGVVLATSMIVTSARFCRNALYEPIVRARRVVSPVSPEGAALIAWLKTNTTKGGRVLFEDWVRWESDFDFVPGWIALESDREVIGGPYWDLSEAHGIFSTYVEGWLFGRDIASFDEAEMRKYLDLYNVGWVVAESDGSVRYYDAHPDLFAPQGAIASVIRLYNVNRPLSFFASGQGSIEATFNRIRLHDVPSEVVLKYHWVRTLRSSDGSPLRPVRLLSDPNPFIAASPRGSELTIDNSYRLLD